MNFRIWLRNYFGDSIEKWVFHFKVITSILAILSSFYVVVISNTHSTFEKWVMFIGVFVYVNNVWIEDGYSHLYKDETYDLEDE